VCVNQFWECSVRGRFDAGLFSLLIIARRLVMKERSHVGNVNEAAHTTGHSVREFGD
jgi:hypothetical protein